MNVVANYSGIILGTIIIVAILAILVGSVIWIFTKSLLWSFLGVALVLGVCLWSVWPRNAYGQDLNDPNCGNDANYVGEFFEMKNAHISTPVSKCSLWEKSTNSYEFKIK